GTKGATGSGIGSQDATEKLGRYLGPQTIKRQQRERRRIRDKFGLDQVREELLVGGKDLGEPLEILHAWFRLASDPACHSVGSHAEGLGSTLAFAWALRQHSQEFSP